MKYTLLLKGIRKSRGMTQAELGEKAGTTARVVGPPIHRADGECIYRVTWDK